MGQQKLSRPARQGGDRRGKSLIRWDAEHSAELASWKARADAGDDWGVDKLLTRPALSPEAADYWAAFVYLSRDRPTESISLGMAGGLSLPRPVPRETIRREGDRRGYMGEGLDDFTEIVAAIDDAFVEVTIKAEAERASAAAKQARSRR